MCVCVCVRACVYIMHVRVSDKDRNMLNIPKFKCYSLSSSA